jgi:hypothetical protein
MLKELVLDTGTELLIRVIRSPKGFIFKPFAHFLSSYYLCCVRVAERLAAAVGDRRAMFSHEKDGEP